MAICSTCSGFGKVGGGSCPSCGGSGKVQDSYNGPGGNKSSSCFPGYTKIMTPIGLKEIDTLSSGDMVITIGKCGLVSQHEIIHVTKHKPVPITTVTTNEKSFDVTPVHTIQTQRGWKKVSQIKNGDKLHRLLPNGKIVHDSVVSISRTTQVESVYNLIVQGDYTFVVDGYIAHSFTYFRTPRMMLCELIYKIRRSAANPKKHLVSSNE